MAVQILGLSPAEQYKASTVPELSTALGQGLQMLANQKLQDVMQQRQKASAMQGLQALGFAPQEAQQLSGLDPFIQREIVKQKLAAPQQQAYAQALGSLLGQPEQAPMEVSDKVEMREGPVTEEARVSEKVPAERKGLSFLSGGLNQQQATELAKLALKKEQATKGEVAERYKATEPYRKEVIDAAKAARSDLKDLNRMEELEKEGKLDTPGYVEFLKRSGFDIPALMNPGSEEFQKISANFLRNAKQYFGARVSNYEIEQFLKTIPSLSQSPEGRKRVIANLKYMSRGALEYNDALKEVIAENGGIPPFDLREKVDEKIEKRLDKISEMFKKDLERPVPKGQNQYITALQAGAGEVLGLPGKLVGKVGSALSSLGAAA